MGSSIASVEIHFSYFCRYDNYLVSILHVLGIYKKHGNISGNPEGQSHGWWLSWFHYWHLIDKSQTLFKLLLATIVAFSASHFASHFSPSCCFWFNTMSLFIGARLVLLCLPQDLNIHTWRAGELLEQSHTATHLCHCRRKNTLLKIPQNQIMYSWFKEWCRLIFLGVVFSIEKMCLRQKNIIEVQFYSARLLSTIVCRYNNIIKAPLCCTDISHSPCVTVY